MEQKKKRFNPQDYGYDERFYDKIESLSLELGLRWKGSLLREFNYNEPSLWPEVISEMVEKEITKCSTDPKSVRVYAILENCSEDAMYAKLVQEGK